MIKHEFGVSKEITAVINAFGILDKRLMPNFSAATKAAAFLFKGVWQDYAGGKEIPGSPPGSAITGSYMNYANTINYKSVNDFQHIVWTDDKMASRVENGVEGLDMKILFKKSSKARTKDDGGWYLTIPLRKGVKQLKSAGISQSKLSKMSFSSSSENQKASMGKGNIVPMSGGKIRKWTWGDTIKTKYGDIVRLKGEPRVTKEGKEIKQTGGYVTFRRASDKSPKTGKGSWVIKEWPKGGGKNIFAMAVKNTKKEIEEMMADGIKSDIIFALTGK